MKFIDLLLSCVTLPLLTNPNDMITNGYDTENTDAIKCCLWADNLGIPSENDFVFASHITAETLNHII